ncbi:MAG: S8 family serine peptidase, partial [Methanosarcinales archaeon]|nr:S8 family serine peptidase [Methanosarcinales archaeon]
PNLPDNSSEEQITEEPNLPDNNISIINSSTIQYERVVVGFKPTKSINIQDSLIQSYDVEILRRCNVLNFVVVNVSSGNVNNFITSISSNDIVRYAELDAEINKINTYTPNDAMWGEQWGPQHIWANYAWTVEQGNSNILISIIDTGIDYNHTDIAANYDPRGRDWVNNDESPWDDEGHGTHCAGIAAAVMDNNIGITGVAQVSVMAEKVLDSSGSGTASNVASGIVHSTDMGADIISLSLGSGVSTIVMQDAVTHAWNNGVVVVAASGNSGDEGVSFPAGFPEVIAVGSVDPDGQLSSFSSHGVEVELVAPGQNVLSLIPGNEFASYSGTSMATPHVAGVAALILSSEPNLTNQEVRDRLSSTAFDLGDMGRDNFFGYGLVDATTAVGGPTPPPWITITYDVPHVMIGGFIDFNATIHPKNSNQSIIWSVDNSTIGTIDENGVFSANVIGETTITATSIVYSNVSKTVQVSVSPPLDEALDNTELVFTTSGDAIWFGQRGIFYHDNDAAESGNIDNNQNSLMQTIIDGPAQISFYWSVSSESGFDHLSFEINGVEQNRISGTDAFWEQKTYIVGEGKQTLVWKYAKDGSVSRGEDRGWVDKIELINLSQPNIILSPSSAEMIIGATSDFNATVFPESANQSVIWSVVNESVGSIDENGLFTSNAIGTTTVVVTSAADLNLTETATVIVLPPLPELSEAVDNNELMFVTGGNADWSGQRNEFMHDGDAAESGDINNNQNSWMETTITSAGTLSFYWMVSSERRFDTLSFEINGVEQNSISGTTATWEQIVVNLEQGTNVLRWTYSKDFSLSRGLDRGWVDKVEFTSDSTISITPTVSIANVGDIIDFNAAIYPDTMNQNVTWSVDNTTVGTIDATTGLFTAQTIGTVDIIATSVVDANLTANITVDVRLFTLIENIPFEINAPGYYMLNTSFDDATFSSAISINANGVVLDGNGHTIDGIDASGTVGISATDGVNVVIKNLIVTDWGRQGIRFDNISNGMITDVVTNSNGDGIFTTESSNNVFSNIVSSMNRRGVAIWSGSNNNSLLNITASANERDGIFLRIDTSNNVLRNNVMYNNAQNFGAWGVQDIDTSNTVNGKPIYYLVGESNVIIDSSSNAGAVYLINSNNITVRDLDLSYNTDGIFMYNTENSLIENINTHSNTWGVHIWNSSNNIIKDVTTSSNFFGLRLHDGSENNIVSHSIVSSNRFGVSIQSSNNNTLSNNDIIDAGFRGLNVVGGSANNHIYLNNFLNNSRGNIAGRDLALNIFNSTTEISYIFNETLFTSYLGNFYDDYTGIDVDGNGIGDVAYQTVDIYPLMATTNHYLLTPTLLSIIPEQVTIVMGDSINFNAIAYPEHTNQSVVWGVSNSLIGTIDANGLFTATAIGVVNVTATSAVNPAISSIALVTITPPTLTLGDAVDNSALDFVTGGDVEWFGQTNEFVYDGDAAESGNITHRQNSWMETTVVGPGVLSFYWNVSSENRWDYLLFEVNGVEQARISGIDATWTQISHAVGQGTNTIRWTYSKDFSLSRGLDRGWVDKVEFINEATPNPTSIIITPSDTLLTIGSATDFNATVLPEGADQSVVWTVSDSLVGTIDANGLFTAVASGLTTVTATSAIDSTIFATASVRVIEQGVTDPIDVRINGPINIVAGELTTYTATILPNSASQEVTWAVLNWTGSGVVDEAGNVLGINAGNIMIVATSVVDSTLSNTLIVTVGAPLPTSMILTPITMNLEIGETDTFIATISPIDADQSVIWAVGNSTVGTISNGLFTALTEGTTTVTATSAINPTISETATVIVTTRAPSSVVVSPSEIVLDIGVSESFTSIASLNVNQEVTWSVSDSTIGMIDETGFFTALAEGTVVVTATSVADSTISGIAIVTVTELATIKLTTGWNLISTPYRLHSNYDSLDEIIGAENYSFAFSFCGVNNQWTLLNGSHILSPLDAIYVSSNYDLTIELKPHRFAGPPAPTTPRHLTAGWNLIGFSGVNSRPVDEALVSLELTSEGLPGYSLIVSTDCNINRWAFFRGHGPAPTVFPTEGYWIFMENGDTLIGPFHNVQ